MARIDVYFHASGGEDEVQADSPKDEKSSVGVAKSKNKDSISESALKSVAIQSGKTIVNSGIEAFSQITGNYIQARQVQNAVSLGATALMMTQFPVGTVAGALSIVTSGINSAIQTRLNNIDTDLLQQRSGNINYDNSRGANQ